MSHASEAWKQRWNNQLPLLKAIRDRRGALKWVQQGCILPAPHLVKKATVAHYARLFHCRLFWLDGHSDSKVTTRASSAWCRTTRRWQRSKIKSSVAPNRS